jgi:hypothetical protein
MDELHCDRGRRATVLAAARRSAAAAPSQGLLIHLSVHKPVDDLCKKAASLCAGGEILGIVAASHAQARASTWENTIHILCIKESPALSTWRAAMADK